MMYFIDCTLTAIKLPLFILIILGGINLFFYHRAVFKKREVQFLTATVLFVFLIRFYRFLTGAPFATRYMVALVVLLSPLAVYGLFFIKALFGRFFSVYSNIILISLLALYTFYSIHKLVSDDVTIQKYITIKTLVSSMKKISNAHKQKMVILSKNGNLPFQIAYYANADCYAADTLSGAVKEMKEALPDKSRRSVLIIIRTSINNPEESLPVEIRNKCRLLKTAAIENNKKVSIFIYQAPQYKARL